jgi:multicomponent Na+:H+ antiporter subunit E
VKRAFFVLALTSIWLAASGSVSPGDVALGLAASFLAVRLSPRSDFPLVWLRRPHKVVAFFFYFLWELLLANLRVMRDVLRPLSYLRPGVVGVPLDATTDLEITLLVTCVALTPGTLTLDLSPDRRVMYIHSMFLDDPETFRRSVKQGFERRLLELLR